MPGILEPAVEKYLSNILPARDAVLADMEAYAKQHDIAIIGPDCGRLLSLMAQISGAKRIFEMGSAIGYSAIWFARAAGPGAEIFCTDGDPANAELARKNFGRAGVAERIRFMTGEAVDLIDSVDGQFDIILIDVYKHQYPAALKKSLPRLKSGGLIITDNVLWSGRVAEPPKDDQTKGILEFNRMVFSSPDLFTVIVPLRDGVAICRKA
ncbi:MAG: O-methyltransferase [Candidatus Acidiferrales bacterium]